MKPLTLRAVPALLFLFSSFISVGQISSADSIKYATQILQLEQNLLNAIASADTTTWSSYLDKKYYIVTEDATAFNKQDFLGSFGPLPKGFSGYIKLIKPHFTFLEKIAILHYVADEYESVFGQKIHTSYATMHTYYRSDDSWKIIGTEIFEIPQLPPAINVSDEILNTYAGTYNLTDTITCTITIENKKLYMQKKGRQKEELFPETNNVFFKQADTRGRKIFVKDTEGSMLMLERRNGQDVVWKRK